MKPPTRETKPDHNTGNYYTYTTVCDKCVSSSTPLANHVTLKMQETLLQGEIPLMIIIFWQEINCESSVQ